MNAETPRGLSQIDVLRRFAPPELDADDLKPIEYLLIPQEFKDGKKIIIQGEPGNAMYFIADGTVEVTKRRFAISSPEHVAFLGAGEVFGEMALVNGELRNADVTAIGDVQAYELKRDDWYRVKAMHPGVAARIEDVAEKRETPNESHA